ncbi:MAG: hypothetical protein IPM54_30675 [Polyangiaceae bacterium]|nr:hypothetical protein [Polyangiaceae bacterium]
MRRTSLPWPSANATYKAAVASAMLATSCTSTPAPVVADPGPPVPVVEHVQVQEILTPLPLRVRLPARYGAQHVLVFVLMWGTHEWKVMELDREGQAWSGEVSCREVSTVTGDTRYFFLALDSAGQPVVSSGSSEWPHVATIVRNLPGGAQSLPGEFRPLRCHDPADCPPDFPGCPAYAVARPACTSHSQCSSGACEWDGYCAPMPKDTGIQTVQLGSDDERLAAAVRDVTRRYQAAAASSRRFF